MPKAKKPRKLAPGQLALICDDCDEIVTRGSVFSEGYLTCESGRWRVYHDQCRTPANSPVVRESRLSSYPLLLNTLAHLAQDVPNFGATDWPQWLRRVVADTEWYFDIEGGQMTAKEMTAKHQEILEAVGLDGK